MSLPTPSPSFPTSTSFTTRVARATSLDAATVREWMEAPDGPRIIDVRTSAEFTTAHIPGAYNVPLDLLKEHADELRHHLDDDVVLVCRSGARASQAEDLLQAGGHSNLHILHGGMTAWEAANGPVTLGAARWDLERQVRFVAGGIVLAGVLVSTVIPKAKWVSGSIGAGLTAAAVSNSCLMGAMLSRLPYNRDGAPDLDDVVRELAAV
ncbi:rhodanese-like domain-containing protein [Dermatophilaceae bacterium Soc4.6]